LFFITNKDKIILTCLVFAKDGYVNIKELLRSVELFDGLADDDLEEVAAICTQRTFMDGEILAKQGEAGTELFIISEGLVEVTVGDRPTPRVVVNLGTGQLIGEMSLVDRGPRSATVCTIHDPTIVQVIQHEAFQDLCQRNTRIGYIVMLNLAADLSFKLRHRHRSGE
jgi:CRP/FNR family cyclic AMP-dependent transcriptional regulator